MWLSCELFILRHSLLAPRVISFCVSSLAASCILMLIIITNFHCICDRVVSALREFILKLVCNKDNNFHDHKVWVMSIKNISSQWGRPKLILEGNTGPESDPLIIKHLNAWFPDKIAKVCCNDYLFFGQILIKPKQTESQEMKFYTINFKKTCSFWKYECKRVEKLKWWLLNYVSFLSWLPALWALWVISSHEFYCGTDLIIPHSVSHRAKPPAVITQTSDWPEWASAVRSLVDRARQL